MGFFQTDADKRASEVRSGAVAPSRTERKKCYIVRDAYYACLDKNNIVDALEDHKKAAKACKQEGVSFERDCATEWVRDPVLHVFRTLPLGLRDSGASCD
jgi:cytochrome c oxidase assembly factor 6